MTSKDPSPDLAASIISSTLSSLPATVQLDRMAAELGLHPSLNIAAFLESTSTNRAPKTIITPDGHTYIELILQDADRRKKPRTGWYWKHGKEYECQSRRNNKRNLTKHWVCDLCTSFKSFDSGSSTHISTHLKTIHSLRLDGEPRAVRSVIDLQRHAPQLRPELSEADSAVILKRTFETALVAFICCAQIAFSIVENEWFVALLVSTSNVIPQVLPTSHNTVRSWVIDSYKQKKQTIKRMVHKARSKIHLSFDLWSSPNYLAIAAIVAHFINADWTVSTVLLAFRDLEGPHSGENIATVITAVCQEYLITDRLGCFVLDNATNNDTCIAQLAREFKWDKKEVTERRLRCFGHIINLVAQEFVFGGKADIFQQSLAAANQDIELDVPKLWELRGPIGKLHYIVVWILRTPQRRKQFARGDETYEAATLVPKRENATRWNSCFQMIKRAVVLRNQIDWFCMKNLRRNEKDIGLAVKQTLTDDDWYILIQMAAAMQCFEDATMALQGRAKDAQFGIMGECIPVIEDLQARLVELQLQYPLAETFESTELSQFESAPNEVPRPGDNPATKFLTECVNLAFVKLAHYYTLTDRSIWYTAGLVLNPTVKWKYLEKQWKDDDKGWLRGAKEKMQQLWLRYKKPAVSTSPSKKRKRAAEINPKPVRREGNYLETSMYNWEDDDSSDDANLDEYEQYCKQKPIKRGIQPHLEYWRERSVQWPNLARLALDALSIPAMSAECERCFSSGTNLINENRYALGEASIEACECQKHWMMNKHA
jgi:hypothetical protein